MTKRFPEVPADYMKWRKRHELTESELKQQSTAFTDCDVKISIVVPAYCTPEVFLSEMIESVLMQTYHNWELCIADGSPDDSVWNIICEYARSDGRIKVQKLQENLGIADNTNAALAMASGDFVGLLDHDDLLEKNALYEIVKVIQSSEQTDVIYTDEDKVTEDLKEYFDPHFKSGFNQELLRSNNYICHFFVVRKEIVRQVRGFRREFDGAQDYDFILRCTELAREIAHIPKPLYHWRTHKASTAGNPESKLYAYESGKHAIEAHLKRVGETGIVSYTNNWGFYHVTYPVKRQEPVSVAIINQGSEKQLRRCIRAIRRTAGYAIEELVVKAQTRDFAFEQMKGTYILLLNSSVKMTGKNWLKHMLGNCQREEVGVVGGRLNYPDETIRHAGIVTGMNGYAFEGMSRVTYGYFHRESLQQNVSAVTLDFLLARKELLVGANALKQGLTEDEIGFGNYITDAGYVVVYDPKSEGYYYGGRTHVYLKKTGASADDPYYNPNLSLETTVFEWRQ